MPLPCLFKEFPYSAYPEFCEWYFLIITNQVLWLLGELGEGASSLVILCHGFKKHSGWLRGEGRVKILEHSINKALVRHTNYRPRGSTRHCFTLDSIQGSPKSPHSYAGWCQEGFWGFNWNCWALRGPYDIIPPYLYSVPPLTPSKASPPHPLHLPCILSFKENYFTERTPQITIVINN